MRNTIRCLSAALALACGLHLTVAQATEHEAAAHGAAAAQEWEMLPGESLRSLAKLFYPRNSYMQQRFINATQALNRDALGAIAADQPFEQSTALRIPDLRALSAQARPRMAKVRHKAAAMAPQPVAAAPQSAAPNAAAQPTGKVDAVQVEAVAKRNQERRAKLEELQKRMQALEDQSRAMQQDLGKKTPAQAAPAPEPAAEAAPKPRKRVVAE